MKIAGALHSHPPQSRPGGCGHPHDILGSPVRKGGEIDRNGHAREGTEHPDP